METCDKTLVRSKMADGSPEERAGPKQMNDITFSEPVIRLGDTKKYSDGTLDDDSVKLSFYRELKTSESCEKSDTRGVAANPTTVDKPNSQKSSGENNVHDDDRKKRCFDRYDSSESSDSGVAVLSPTESSGCSGSDITEPRSPRSPESACSISEESAGARMPPWAHETAPPRRTAPPQAPTPTRRPQAPHRRITEYFNHKMKPQNGFKRETTVNDDTKKKCLPKNGVTHDLEKYISYLSQTLSPKVLMDVGKQTENTTRKSTTINNVNGVIDSTKKTDLSKPSPNSKLNSTTDVRKTKDKNEKTYTNLNGFLDVRHHESCTKEKQPGGLSKGLVECKKRELDLKTTDPSANGIVNKSSGAKRKGSIAGTSDVIGFRIAPATSATESPKKITKMDTSKMNGVVSSTTTFDSRMNGVTCGSNNLNLSPITKPTVKKEIQKKPTQHAKKTNRKSSACIANSKNLTWSKANNLKQVQLQKLNCSNSSQSTSVKPAIPVETNSVPNMNIQNGVRHVSMTVNSSLSNVNVPVTNFQNCHQISISQPCNGSVSTNNLASFVAVPQNVMLTTLRIPQTGQTFNGANISAQQNNINNMTAFNRSNVNVSSPTKLNGQFVFPLVQNINGTVVQIPNLVAKMPNFVLPQTSQLSSQRQDHLQNQQGASILINATLLKLANTVTSPYTNVNKPAPVTSQSIPIMNKNVPGIQTVGMTVQSKPNYTVNFSHPVLVPQPGFIVTSVPNINVKETWSSSNTSSAPSSQNTCNPIVHHPPPIVANYTTQSLHTSSIPIAPVKPPDNPIQGTDPPSSTVKEPECCERKPAKCDVPWLSKTVNNNILTLESNKMSKKGNTRPFAHVSSIAEKLGELAAMKTRELKKYVEEVKKSDERLDTCNEISEMEKVTRREETIFTQITVLKDVSSDVHNTVIETNFCCTTTESESGIGTDKSIDSPSDSQISKECDEDSSLSLSVSVCSVDVPSQKSPILKQPKTLRFPPRSLTKPNSDKRTSSTDTTSTVTVCLWENCKMEFDGDSDLLDHLQSVHVEPQAGKDNYVCLWEQCKVRGKPSCSRLWLERHTQSHGGNKPFKCIVDGCERRFSTQTLLERHVNNHFNETSPSGGSNKKNSDSSVKLIRRNGKKLRYRRQPWSARMFDFFDASMMEGLAWRLTRVTSWRLAGACPLREQRARHTLTLRATLTATRYNTTTRRREALLTYYPPHVLEDEWVPEKEVTRYKRVDMSTLSANTKVLLYSQFCASYRCVIPTNTTVNTPVKRPEPRRCASSRILSSLLSKRRRTEAECRTEPLPYCEDSTSPEVSGAKKRKLGRRYGGNSFWPCGR